MKKMTLVIICLLVMAGCERRYSGYSGNTDYAGDFQRSCLERDHERADRRRDEQISNMQTYIRQQQFDERRQRFEQSQQFNNRIGSSPWGR